MPRIDIPYLLNRTNLIGSLKKNKLHRGEKRTHGRHTLSSRGR